jgi:hypothetical protein
MPEKKVCSPSVFIEGWQSTDAATCSRERAAFYLGSEGVDGEVSFVVWTAMMEGVCHLVYPLTIQL